jgi:hypothetical protein
MTVNFTPVKLTCVNLINDALRDHIGRHAEPLEELLRRVLREELREAR